ncbi:MAG: aspartate carbamoyltransferase catalytic subunit [Chloroflexi bacterium]|nr:aspartate carbamoyltransferase catalytic subunit [Chloroflexota bacterium]
MAHATRAATRSAARVNQQAGLWAGPRQHLLDLDDFSRVEIEEVLLNADGMKEVLGRGVRKTPALRGKTIVTVFYEASTRTRVSFEQAGKILGADVINVTADASSVKKGESLLNTVLTLQAMQIDALVMRHPHSGAPYFVAAHMDTSVVNAGDGTHAHPTQALLDIYTIERMRGKLSGKKVAIIGDILYSRVARSNMIGMRKMGAEVVVSGPATLLPHGFKPGAVVPEGQPFEGVRVAARVEEAIEGADVVMVLRIQRERQDAGHLPSLREYSREYGVNAARLKLAKPDALLMHPGPMNEGVEISSEVAHGSQSVIEDQVANGVAVRMAVLYMLCARARNGGS